MQCSPSFDCNWGKQNDPTAHWHQLHPRYPVLQQENVSATHHRFNGGPNPTDEWLLTPGR